MHLKGVLIGYARVSTLDQNLTLQRDAPTVAGCTKLFVEQISVMVLERPALRDALEFARARDTVVVWKLDRLARSMSQLIETLEALRAEKHRLSESDESARHDDAAGTACLSPVRRSRGIRARPDPRAHFGGAGRREAVGAHGRPTGETHRRRPRRGDDAVSGPRHRRCRGCRARRSIYRDALSLFACRADDARAGYCTAEIRPLTVCTQSCIIRLWGLNE